MQNDTRSKNQLLMELAETRQRVSELEARMPHRLAVEDDDAGRALPTQGTDRPIEEGKIADFTGREVSCRALGILFQELRKKELAPESLTAGVRYPLKHLLNKHERIDWASYRALMANARHIWSDEELVTIGGMFMKSPWAKPITVVGRLLYTANDFYKWAARPGPINTRDFSCIEPSLREFEPAHLELSITMHSGYEPCREFFLITKGVLVAIPQALGLAPATVQMTAIENGVRYVIQVPAGGGVLAWLRRAVTWPFTARTAARELQEAHEVLQLRYLELEAEIIERKQVEEELQHYRSHLEALVAKRTEGLKQTNHQLQLEITERLRAEEALQESEELLNSILETISDGILVLDRDFHYTFWNRAMERISKTPRKQVLVRKKPWEIFPHLAEQGVDKLMQRAMRDETVSRTDIAFWLADGTSGYTSETFLPLKTPSGEIRGIVGVVHDTTVRKQVEDELRQHRNQLEALVAARTGELAQANENFQQEIIERRQAEAALRDSEEKYRLLFSTELDAIVLVDSESRQIIDANEAALRLYGYNRAEMLKLTGLDLSAEPEHSAKNISRVVGLPTDRTHLHYSNHIKKDGTVFPVEISAGSFLLRDRKVVYAVFRDITERKQAEQALHTYSERLEELVEARTSELKAAQERLIRQEKLAVIGQMSGSIAHELRNPLGSIKQSCFYLKHLDKQSIFNKDNPKVNDHLELIEAEIDTADRVITNLLDLTRMKPPKQEAVDLQTAIVEAVHRAKLSEQIQLRLDFNPEPFLIWADPTQIQQVFVNLLTNAGQACSANGQITISARLLIEEKQVQIKMSDNGRGIDVDTITKVFEPLYTTKAQGTGLGLSICRQIIETHQGSITLSSRVAQGTTVRIVLPDCLENLTNL